MGSHRATELLEVANDGLRPEGRPLYAGQLALGLPGDPIGDVWRLGDRLREYRGDSHIASWASAGFDATEIGLLTELYWGLPMRTYVRSRAWSDDELDAAEARLIERGLVADGAFTEKGRDGARRSRWRPTVLASPSSTTWATTSTSCSTSSDGWASAVQAAGGYPATGPHDLAQLSQR